MIPPIPPKIEFTIDLPDKSEVACQVWGHSGYPVVCVHGWMDNSASFQPIAPYLVQAGYRLFCVDLTGHGRSSHREDGTPVMVWVVELVDIIKELGFKECYIIGHSMGGAISIITTSVLKYVKKLVIIDIVAPLTLKDEYAPKLLDLAIRERTKILTRKSRIYPDIDVAVKKMLSTNPYIKESSVRLLVERGTENVYSDGESGIRFLHDTKLVAKPLQVLSEGQITAYIRNVDAPVLLILATQRNFPMNDTEERMKAYKDLTVVTVESGHHPHMDQPEICQNHILSFFGTCPINSKL